MLKIFSFFLCQCIFLKSYWQFFLSFVGVHGSYSSPGAGAEAKCVPITVENGSILCEMMGRPPSLLHEISPGKAITRPYYYTINLLSSQLVILQRQTAELHFSFLDSLIGEERIKVKQSTENTVIHNFI